jgi:LysR family nitrogen assimilation transcriptional regulator
MNSVNAISSSLGEGLGCAIGTRLFLQEPLESGQLHYRPIIEPELSRTLHICEFVEPPSNVALEKVREITLSLIKESVHDKTWDATIL